MEYAVTSLCFVWILALCAAFIFGYYIGVKDGIADAEEDELRKWYHRNLVKKYREEGKK